MCIFSNDNKIVWSGSISDIDANFGPILRILASKLGGGREMVSIPLALNIPREYYFFGKK